MVNSCLHHEEKFQCLIRKCEECLQEKRDQFLASNPDANFVPTNGIDRTVLEEMWLMDNLIGKKFILQKLKTLYYEDKVNNNHIQIATRIPET